jgi:hypothetical protein
MSLSEEISELMKEGQSTESEFTIDDLLKELAADKKPKIKPNAGFIPAPFEAQWIATSTILSVDVRTCQACGTIHSMPIGFFLEQTHKAVFSDRRLTQIHASIHSMPELYRNLPSKIEETHSTIGFCNVCFGLAPSLSNPFYTHVPTSTEAHNGQAQAPTHLEHQGPPKETGQDPSSWDLYNPDSSGETQEGRPD